MIGEKVDLIINQINRYKNINEVLANIVQTSTDQTEGAFIYGTVLNQIMNNLNVISDFTLYTKTTVKFPDSNNIVIQTTENFLNLIIDSSKNLQNILSWIDKGGWTAELSDNINAVFSRMPGLASKIVSHLITVCQYIGNDPAPKNELADDLTQLNAQIGMLSYIFDNVNTVTGTLNAEISDFDDEMSDLYGLLDDLKNSYNDSVQIDINSINKNENDFVKAFILILSVRAGTISYTTTERDITYTDGGNTITIDPSISYLNEISLNHFFGNIDKAKADLTAYTSPIRKSLLQLDEVLVKLIFNDLKNKHIAQSISCMVADSGLPGAIQSILNPRFDALYTESIPSYFIVPGRYSASIAREFQLKLNSLYNIFKTVRTSKLDVLRALKQVHTLENIAKIFIFL